MAKCQSPRATTQKSVGESDISYKLTDKESISDRLLVAPIFLKKNARIEALMFVYFLAQLLCALIERQLRITMKEKSLPHIQILPEDRPSATPTSEQLVRVFNSRAKYLLLTKEGHLAQVFTDPLTPIQQQILDLLSISPRVYA